MHSARDTPGDTSRSGAGPDAPPLTAGAGGSGAGGDAFAAAAEAEAVVPRDVSHEALLPYLTRIMAGEKGVGVGTGAGAGADAAADAEAQAGAVDALMAMYMSIREAEAPLSLQTVQEVVAACFHAGRADSALGVVADVLLKGVPHPSKASGVVGADLPLCHQVRAVASAAPLPLAVSRSLTMRAWHVTTWGYLVRSRRSSGDAVPLAGCKMRQLWWHACLTSKDRDCCRSQQH